MLRVRTFVILILVYVIAFISLKADIDLMYPYTLIRNYTFMPLIVSAKNKEVPTSDDYQKTLILELQEEVKKLKEINDIKTVLVEHERINATVIERNRNYWFNTVTLDKGSSSGLVNDMAVIDSKGLIGKISNVSRNMSEIKLLTTSDVNNKTSVVIMNGNNKIYGLIEGYQNGYLEVVITTKNITIDEGLTVMTSGMGGVYPSGILIGTVSGTKKAKYDVGVIILVTPASDFDNLKYVSVLKRK